MAKHPASIIAVMLALVGAGGCFEESPTQPPSLGASVRDAAHNVPMDPSIFESVAVPPQVTDVARHLNHDHPAADKASGKPHASSSPSPAPTSSGGEGGGGGGGGFSSSTVAITDVLYGGQSVVGPSSPATLVGDLDGAPVQLRITGSGFAYPEDFPNIATKYLVHLDPTFVAQTFIGNPKYRVLLDDSIALEPQDGGTFTANQLDATLPRKGVLDLMLAGEHSLSVTVGFQKATAKVRFAAPSIRTSLAPKVTSAKLVKAVDDETDTSEWLIELKGSNYLLDFRKSYAKLNGQRAYWHASYVGATESVGYAHIPEGALQAPGTNSLTVITPFGIALAAL